MIRFFRYGLLMTVTITVINFVFIALAQIINTAFSTSLFIRWLIILFACLLPAVVVAYLVLSASPLLKDYLKTFRRLIRLESLNHPLLVKFSHAAPGTYHHTLTVANIASRAAKAIGADSLLTRIGAYYHDVGKMEGAENFVENQSNGRNPHDHMQDPTKSVQIIINHVKNGITIAKENHLPDEVIGFIAQHHGTSTVSYFYNEAKKQGLKIKKSDFRYPGPKPLSREAAILMLADTVEATVRSHPNPTVEDIKRLASEAIEQRLAEHQLDLSGLTNAQLIKIRQSFIESLIAVFHQRISYPQNKKGKSNNASQTPTPAP